MSGLKKWMAIIMTSVTIMGNMAGQGISVMGAENEAQEVISSGNIYVTENCFRKGSRQTVNKEVKRGCYFRNYLKK